VVALDGDELVAVTIADGDRIAPANLGSAPLADIDLNDQGSDQRTVVAVGDDAHLAMTTALDEWRSLTAAWLVGLARAALGIGIRYVKERRQFGVPIGSFQAVQHRLADLATAVEGANLLADKAAWALDVGDASAATLPAMAYSFCGETAQGVTSAVLHLHGGYGFMEEYDIQLYFRRAKATRLVLADPRRELQHLAGRLFGPTEPT
jgi:alkylation response protein AidB-like acyl-CoA dehydrogenase